MTTPSIGSIGEIDPKVVEFERVPFRVFAFELDLESLEDAFKTLPVYHQLLRQPAVTRDLAVVVRDRRCRMPTLSIRSGRRPVPRSNRSGWSTSIKALRSRPDTRVWRFTCFSATPSAR